MAADQPTVDVFIRGEEMVVAWVTTESVTVYRGDHIRGTIAAELCRRVFRDRLVPQTAIQEVLRIHLTTPVSVRVATNLWVDRVRNDAASLYRLEATNDRDG